MKNRKFKIAKGFTLAEAMIAMTILAVATAAVILPFAGGSAIRRDIAKRTIATRLAADLLEEIVNSDLDIVNKRTNYDGFIQWPGCITDATGALVTDPESANFIRVASCQDAFVAGEKLIWATAYIYEDGAGTEFIKLSTLIGP
jgi:prepilin-type N-terminal cleavage/methylation domain-containing protein